MTKSAVFVAMLILGYLKGFHSSITNASEDAFIENSTYFADGFTDAPGTADPDSLDTDIFQRRWFTEKRLGIIYCTVGVLGLLGNSFVILVIYNYTAMRKRITNIFIINQSFIDGMTSLVLILGVAFQDQGEILSGAMGSFVCRVWYNKAILWGCLNVSTFNLLAVTLERFIAVVYPIKYKSFVSLRNANIACAVLWASGLLVQIIISVPPAGLLNGRCNFLRFWPSRSFQQGVGVFVIILKFILPLCIICYCYARIAKVLQSRISVTLDATPSGGSANPESRNQEVVTRKRTDNMEKAKRNVIKTLVIVTVCYVLCWTTNQVYFLYFNSGNPIDFEGWFYHFTVIAVYCNCCCNPFIYIAQYKQFQMGISRLKSRMRQQISGFSEASPPASN